MQIFRDRLDAGAQLAQELQGFAERPDVIVLALPRGGVPVGYEIATRLAVPLDVLIVRKLGVPGHEELAMGALASGGIQLVDRAIVSAMHVSTDALQAVIDAERDELDRRERLYRAGCPSLDVRDQTLIVVDDGLATGASMLAALEALRQREPAELVVAVPVAAAPTCAALRAAADDVICLLTPPQFYAVGLWYQDFRETTDAEVRALLDAARARLAPDSHATGAAAASHP
jgi:putative phosphoribosyl transferase